jgi:threonine synthase
MDIQISSNFERLIFESAGRDAGRVCQLMDDLGKRGGFTLSDSELEAMRSLLSAEAVDEAEVERTIRDLAVNTGYICDPHTAVGIAAAHRYPAGETPMVTLATAHPAKFPDAVEAATGQRPDVPARLKDALDGEERFSVLENDYAALTDFIECRA